MTLICYNAHGVIIFATENTKLQNKKDENIKEYYPIKDS